MAVFKGLANLGNIMRQAQQMGGRMQEITQQLKAKKVTGSAGGGMVEVEANGLGEILRVHIDPMLIERQEREMIEDLIPAAVNQAITKAKELHAEQLQSLTSGMELPGIQDALAQLTGAAGVTGDGSTSGSSDAIPDDVDPTETKA